MFIFKDAMKNIYVIGEIHSNAQSVRHVQERINTIKPRYLLHELLYDDECFTDHQTKERLRECRIGGVCDPRLNQDVYELGLKLRLNLVGIDLNDPAIDKLSVPEQFSLREKNMVMVISRYLKLPGNPKIVIVVGDTHLREIGNSELIGPSPLITLLRNDARVVIERVPEVLQEVS